MTTNGQGTARLGGVSFPTPAQYSLPLEKLKRHQTEAKRTPLVLVACGSFSPITYLHLRMFEMCLDYVKHNTEFEVMGSYLSPVSDAYKKVGLAPAIHRVNMCERAVEHSDWIMVDTFETSVFNEAGEPQYVPTAQVLAHMDYEVNTVLGGVTGVDGTQKKVKLALLAGSDLILTMSTPNLWSPTDLDIILGSYGAFIIERSGTDIDEALASLQQYEKNIWVISQSVQNDISSTKVRLFLKKDLSVRYLLPDSVIEYIAEHKLYGKHGLPRESEAKSSGPDGESQLPTNSSPSPLPSAKMAEEGAANASAGNG